MRIATLIALFLAALAGFLIARLPLTVALALLAGNDLPLTYSGARGTVWDGAITDVTVRDVRLADAQVALDPVSFLSLTPRLEWRLRDGPVTGKGRISYHPGGEMRLADTAIDADLARLPVFVSLRGRMAASIGFLVVDKRGCREAEGRVRTNALQRRPAGLDWRGPALAGRLSCRDGSFVLTMSGEGDEARVSIDARVAPDLAYHLKVAVEPDTGDLRRGLELLGFEEDGAAYRLTRRGILGAGKAMP